METRSRIMDAARDLFAREGYDAVSMRRIAEVIEYSPTAIYVHFRDKQDLLFQICQSDFVALAEGVVELQKVKDPVERIKRMGHAYIRFGVKHPNHYRLMFMTRMDLPPEVILKDENHGKVDRDSYALLCQSCQEAIDQNRIRPEYRDADLVAQLFWSAVHGLTSLHIVKSDNPWVNWKGIDALSDAVVDSILRGATLASQDARARPPSPGTPGEGRGEGSPSVDASNSTLSETQDPHPGPLPEYRERGQRARHRTRGRAKS